MQRWIDAGVGPARLFAAMTINNARFFGLDSEIGSVELGKRADLLLLETNPLGSVDAYDSIVYVVIAGNAMNRKAFSASMQSKQ